MENILLNTSVVDPEKKAELFLSSVVAHDICNDQQKQFNLCQAKLPNAMISPESCEKEAKQFLQCFYDVQVKKKKQNENSMLIKLPSSKRTTDERFFQIRQYLRVFRLYVELIKFLIQNFITKKHQINILNMRRRVNTTTSNNNLTNSQNISNLNEQDLQQKMYNIIDLQMNEFKEYMTQKLLANFSKQKMVNYIEEFEKVKQKKKQTKRKNQKTHKKKICSQSFISNKSVNRKIRHKKQINFHESVLVPNFEFQRKKTKKKLGVRSMINSPSHQKHKKMFKKVINFNVGQNNFSFKKKQTKILKTKKNKIKFPEVKKCLKTPKAPKKKQQCQCQELLQNPIELESQRQMEKYLNGNFNQNLIQNETENDFNPQSLSVNQSKRKSSESDSQDNIFQKSYEQIDVQSQSQQDKSESDFQQGLQIGDFDNIEKSNEDNYEIILRESNESSHHNSHKYSNKKSSNKRLTFGQEKLQNFQQFSQTLNGRELSLTNLSEVIPEENELLQSERNNYQDDDYGFELEKQRKSLKQEINNLKNSLEK